MSDQVDSFLNDFFYQGNVCPSCKKGIEIRSTESIYFACIHCHKYLEKNGSTFTVVSSQDNTKAKKPDITLYSKCVVDAATYEVIAYRYVKQKNFSYYWKEYILHSSHKPVIYLAEFDGHWTITRPMNSAKVPKLPRTTIFEWEGKDFRLYNRYQSVTVYAEGEFDHDIVRETSPVYSEYVNPPQMLIMEKAGEGAIHWSVAEYLYKDELIQLFPKAVLPERIGVGACQPFPRTFPMKDFNRLVYVLLGLLLVLQFLFVFTASRKVLYSESITIVDSTGFVAPVVTPDFKIENTVFGRTNLEFKLSAPVSNSWLETDINLIHNGTDEEISFQEGVEYYSGYDWSEGSTHSSSTLSEVNEGPYHMVINVYRDPATNPKVGNFQIEVVQDVPMWSNFFVILVALMVYPVFMWIRKMMFENRRWSQSDFGND